MKAGIQGNGLHKLRWRVPLAGLITIVLFGCHRGKQPLTPEQRNDAWEKLNGAAIAAHAKNDMNSAGVLFETAYEAASEFPEGDSRRLTATANLATFYWENGQIQKANELQKSVVRAREKSPLPPNSLFIDNLVDMAAAAMSGGRYDEAEKTLNRAGGLLDDLVKPDDIMRTHYLAARGTLFFRRKQYSQAAEVFRHQLRIEQKELGPDHPKVASTKRALAMPLAGLGRYDEAGKLNREALESLKRRLGPDHPDTLRAMNDLGTHYAGMRDYKHGIPLVKQALAGLERIYGPDHPQVRSIRESLRLMTAHSKKPPKG